MEAVARGGMASSFRGAGGGAEPEDVAVLVGLTLHREDLSPTDLSKKSYTEAPPEMCERRATHPDLRLPLAILWEIRVTSYDEGGTPPAAFLPRPHVTQGQLADPSNHRRSFSYIRRSENTGANAETSAEPCGLPPSAPTSNSRTPHRKILSEPVQAHGAQGHDTLRLPCGITESEGTQQALWFSSLPPGWSASKSFTCSGLSVLLECTVVAEKDLVCIQSHADFESAGLLFSPETLVCGEPQDYLKLILPTSL